MRQVAIMTLLVSILISTIHCGDAESIGSLLGRTEIASAPDTILYVLTSDSPDVEPVSLMVLTDSIRWVNEFPPGGSSSLSIIISGQSELDLDVETYINGAITTVPLVRDSLGVFIDTVQIAVSPLPEVLLTECSRLFLRNGGQVLDSIRLVNPWQY